MSRTLKAAFNDANPNILPDLARTVKLGTLLGAASAQCRAVVASHITDLPEGMRVGVLLAAYATVGTLTGAMTVVTGGAPTTGQVSITPTGQVIFATADAVTEAELYFIPASGDIVEELVPLNGAGLGTLGGSRHAKLLISAEVTTGASTGVKTVIARAGSPSAAQAALTANGSGVQFNVAAASSMALIRYIKSADPGASSSELLNTAQSVL